MPLTAAICAEARRLGFVAAGTVRAGPSISFPRYEAWLAGGYAAGLDYLKRNTRLRSDVRQLAPWAKSLIVVAAPYPAIQPPGQYSAYAQGQDYHVLLRSRLKQLAHSLAGLTATPLRYRACAGSAPLLEREWAVRAGLGWIGRQGCLVNPQWGCTLFLGSLLVNLELAQSQPLPSQCGDCRLCLEACPTGAIQAGRHFDARRCLAYLTTEHRGDWPLDAPLPRNGTLFGCDYCTVICPYNRRQQGTAWPEFEPAKLPLPGPQALLEMDEAQFQQRFRGTAIQRTGLAGLQRNAQAVLKARTQPHYRGNGQQPVE